MNTRIDNEGLPSPYSIKRHGVTLTNCDSEPVQTPGCIQGHGALLALRPTDLIIQQASENCARWLGAAPLAILGTPISSVLGEHLAHQLRDFLAHEPVERNPLYVFTAKMPLTPDAPPLDVTVHTADGVVLLEFETTGRSEGPTIDYYSLIKRATARLQASPTLADFCQAGAEEVRAATGLDRVMVYRFLADHSGEVFAEARRADLHSWLGLRYPAEDIPRPAREIFQRIGIRPLPDAAAEPVEMIPLANPETGRQLEMTHCALRGASVMYTEYLLNMGVAASLTMPILRDGELWGLFAGHHYSPTRFPYQVRAAAELLGQVTSLQIKNAEMRAHHEDHERIATVHSRMMERCAGDGALSTMLENSPGLMDGIECGGAALYQGGKWWTAGKTPNETQLDMLAAWLRTVPEMAAINQPIFACDALPTRFIPAATFADVASGLLAVPLAHDQRNLICWFRPEQEQTFSWAGNPYEKPTAVGPHGARLTPRTSFELWQEQVRGRAVPFNATEIDAALKLRFLVMDLVVSQAEKLATLNAELSRSNEELDAFAYVASHDLKEPLRGIHKYAHYLMEEAQAGAFSEQAKERLEGLQRLTVRMDGLLEALLHFSRVGQLRLEFQEISLAAVLNEAAEMLGARIEESGAKIRVPRNLPVIRCDRIRVREILANLISNAIKYNEQPDKWVEVGYLEPGENPPAACGARPAHAHAEAQRIFYLRDNGIGIDARHSEQIFKMFKRLHVGDAYGGGAGAGLAIVKKLVEQHQGKIWVESAPGQGSTFFFTLPCDNAASKDCAKYD